MTDTLADALPREMARIRDVVIPEYDAIPGGALAAAMMRQDLDRAARAMAEGDVVVMLAVYQEIKQTEPDMMAESV